MKKLMVVFIITLTIGVIAGFAETTAMEITRNEALMLMESRIFYTRDVGLSIKDESGVFNNDINNVEPGSAYITKNGILHVGQRAYLFPWQHIKSIGTDKMAGSSSAILIRTTIPTEKIQLLDPKQIGNLNTLDTAMDTLLRQLSQTFKQYQKNPEQFAIAIPSKPLKGTLIDPRNLPPEPHIKKDPVETKEIKVGMTFAEVEALLGAPLKKLILDDKVTYKYTDMVLTFKEGKLVDGIVK